MCKAWRLLVSQRPTLMRLLEEQSFSSLGDYLNTLREGANLDLVLVCSDGRDVTGLEQNVSIASLCLESRLLDMLLWTMMSIYICTPGWILSCRKARPIKSLAEKERLRSLHSFKTRRVFVTFWFRQESNHTLQ